MRFLPFADLLLGFIVAPAYLSNQPLVDNLFTTQVLPHLKRASQTINAMQQAALQWLHANQPLALIVGAVTGALVLYFAWGVVSLSGLATSEWRLLIPRLACAAFAPTVRFVLITLCPARVLLPLFLFSRRSLPRLHGRHRRRGRYQQRRDRLCAQRLEKAPSLKVNRVCPVHSDDWLGSRCVRLFVTSSRH